jgi:hypothetical protein
MALSEAWTDQIEGRLAVQCALSGALFTLREIHG